VVAVPTSQPQWTQDFLKENNFTFVKTSTDIDKLREVFKFEYPPYGVVIERGRQTGLVPNFDAFGGPEPVNTLRQLGVIE
jgi:hypothetical protein